MFSKRFVELDDHERGMHENRLIKEYSSYDTDTLEDYLLLLARNVENALHEAGGIPGKDFDFKFIFSLAVQIFNHGKNQDNQ